MRRLRKLISDDHAQGMKPLLVQVARNIFLALKVKHGAAEPPEGVLRLCLQSAGNVQHPAQLMAVMAVARALDGGMPF